MNLPKSSLLLVLVISSGCIGAQTSTSNPNVLYTADTHDTRFRVSLDEQSQTYRVKITARQMELPNLSEKQRILLEGMIKTSCNGYNHSSIWSDPTGKFSNYIKSDIFTKTTPDGKILEKNVSLPANKLSSYNPELVQVKFYNGSQDSSKIGECRIKGDEFSHSLSEDFRP